MRLSTSTNILFERPNGQFYEVEKSIQLCADAGYKVMDFSIHDLTTAQTPFIGDNWEPYIHQLRELADRLGIEFSQGHATLYDFCSSKEDHELKEKFIYRSIKAASILGVKWLAMHPSTCYDTATMIETSKAINIKYFRKYAEYAGKLGVGIALENMWDLSLAPKRRYTTTAEELVDLVDAIDCENVGICWDVEHASIQQQDQGLAIRHIGNRLKSTHISDQTGIDNIHVLPYQGVTDWDDILKALVDIDYQGDFTYEIQHFTYKMPEALYRPSLRYSYEIGQYLIEQFEKLKKSDSK